ncbi:scavenger receptor cysteine-rich domain-containing protein DMBT1-like [Mustelus asterias]
MLVFYKNTRRTTLAQYVHSLLSNSERYASVDKFTEVQLQLPFAVVIKENLQLRLSDGGSRCAGRVEVLYRGEWGSVCNDDWEVSDAAVVCRQLGCGNSLDEGLISSGSGSGPILLDDVECSGEEPFLWNCSARPWGQQDCDHSEDVMVMCSGNNGPRLIGGEDRCSGRVEVLHGEHWGTLCDVYFDLEDANVVCQHLQCGAVDTIPRNAHFGNGTGPIWKETYRCRGNESRLEDCPLSSGEKFNCSHLNDAVVICSDAIFSLRVSNGGSRCDGRVEIDYNHSWGRVQDSLWDMNDANVTCRQLCCGAAVATYNNSKYGEGEGPVWVNDVQCEGNESHLWNCSAFTMNPHRSDNIGVGVLCSEHKQLRLSDGGSSCAGRVEIYYNDKWGSVCDDSWDAADAQVVCKQLGCGDALQLPLPASCGPGMGAIWLDELDCIGNESFLWNCPSASWGKHDCSHKEDVKVTCSHKELRLVNGNHRCEGRVEVFYNGAWGTVCAEKLDRHDAEVICKQLQCGLQVSIDHRAQLFGEGSDPIWLDEIECSSHESTIWQCLSDPWGQHNCHHLEDAGVVCSKPKATEAERYNSRECSGQADSGLSLHLVGGNTKCSGRVEVLCNNTWGMVCDDYWDIADANVVRRQLNCGPALLASGGAMFGVSNTAVWLDEVKCTGSESILSDCTSASSTQPDCDHKEAASVICSVPASIDSLNQVVYYTRNRFSDTDPASENPQGDPCSAHSLDDDVETGSIDSQRRHMLLDCTADDHSMLTIGGANVSTLVAIFGYELSNINNTAPI